MGRGSRPARFLQAAAHPGAGTPECQQVAEGRSPGLWPGMVSEGRGPPRPLVRWLGLPFLPLPVMAKQQLKESRPDLR